MLSAGEGRTGPKERQPLIDRAADPWTQQADTIRAHLAVKGIGAVRDPAHTSVRISHIGIRAVIALVADGVIVGLEAPHPLVDLKVGSTML